MHWVFLFRSSIRSVRSPITKPGEYPQRHLVEKGNLVLKGLNMNVVVSNQAVLEKNSPLVLTSFFFLTFFLVICLYFSSGNAPHASLQWAGGGHSQEGRVGLGRETTSKHLHIQKCSSGFRMDMVRKLLSFQSEQPGESGPVWGFLGITAEAPAGATQLSWTKPNPLI